MMPKPVPAPFFINCHTHIFTGQSVPPYLAKTFLPWPLYRVFSIPFILRVCRFWYISKKSPRQWKHKWWYKKIQRIVYAYRSFVRRTTVANLVISAINLIIVYHALFYFSLWLISLFIKTDGDTKNFIIKAAKWLEDHRLLWLSADGLLKLAVVLFTVFFISRGRKLIFFILKKLWSFLSILPDKKTIQFMARYINIGRFAYYKQQGRIFIKMKDQYPEGTGFVLLPMDMEFIDAGTLKPSGSYDEQMKDLAAIKANKRYKDLVFPFVFVDPRRKNAGGKIFFDWQPGPGGTVILKDCFIKEYIESKKFSGFKIYPALGYYPFDEALLPLWKYAADNKIPLLTHCIRGTIFYRGKKKKDWGEHPVFKQAEGLGTHHKLLLPELKNSDFINNFTHPLNYLCIVEEKLLRILVAGAGDTVKSLFGYTNPDTPLEHNLEHLKLCFGHFGGEDEWQKYFEKDRDDFTSQLVKRPGRGIEFIKQGPIDASYDTLENIWKNVDWYSIISSMMLQYENLYADISYIVHDNSIYPLLKQSLSNAKLKRRILFGTDFYVVRNHKSEKEMLADIQAALNLSELYFIGRKNPKEFLNIP